MKKIFALTILLIFLSKAGSSQSQFEFGVQYEPQRTWIINSTYEDELTYVSTYGHALGLSFIHSTPKKISLESGIMFSSQGQKFTESHVYNYNSQYDSTTLNIQFDLNYIKIPLLAGVSGKRTSKVFISCNLGPQFSFLSSAKLIVEDTEQSPYNYNENIDNSSTYKSITIDVAFRLGINVYIKKDLLFSTLFSMDQSLSDTDEGIMGAVYTPSSNRTMGCIFRLSYVYSKK